MKKNTPRKQIVVIGLGQFGTHLAQELSANADVLAIDQAKERVDSIADSVQQARCLDATDCNSLRAVVRQDIDEAIVCMGESLEASILCALHLKKIGVASIRAKAVNDDHAIIFQSIGVNQVIFPERETAKRMAMQIVHPNLLDFVPIGKNFRVMDVAAPKSFYNQTLANLELRKRFNVFAVAIRKVDKGEFIFLPGPDYVINDKDVLVLIGSEEGLVGMSNQS